MSSGDLWSIFGNHVGDSQGVTNRIHGVQRKWAESCFEGRKMVKKAMEEQLNTAHSMEGRLCKTNDHDKD